MKLLSLKRVAETLDVSTKTVRRWIAEGIFPKPVMLPGKLPRWEAGEVDAWVARSQNPPEPEGGVKRKTEGQKGTQRDREGQISA